MTDFNINELMLAFDSLCVYRNLLNDGVIKKLYELGVLVCRKQPGADEFIRKYNEFFFELTSSNTIQSLKEYVIKLILFDENPFSRQAEKLPLDSIDEIMIDATSKDLDRLYDISRITSQQLKEYALANICTCEGEKRFISSLPAWEFDNKREYGPKRLSLNFEKMIDVLATSSKWGECVKNLSEFYFTNGSGIFARYNAFVWEPIGGEPSLRGIESPDPIRLSDFIGYEQERLEVIENTEKFVKGLPANNVLLYGDRGTGKSSTVKAIANEYREQGLRIIEIPRKYLVDFPAVLRLIKGRKCRFIIFVDDLAFEDSEESYTVLKSVLEGGVENRPDNVLIYATSNRRHLIKEKFSDRAGFRSDNPDDEVRAQDTLQEKLSLSERFGITVIFSSPDKKRFLEIVEGLAAKRGISIDRDKLQKEAMKWELMYNGRSARTARQFVDWLEGSENLIK